MTAKEANTITNKAVEEESKKDLNFASEAITDIYKRILDKSSKGCYELQYNFGRQIVSADRLKLVTDILKAKGYTVNNPPYSIGGVQIDISWSKV